MSTEPESRIPYVGPRPFERDEGEFFFGRRLEVNDLIALVTTYQVVLLYAQSGAGKTSLLQASLIPRMENEEKFHVFTPVRVRSKEAAAVLPGRIGNIFIYNVLRELAGPETPQDELAQMSLAEFIRRRKEAADPKVAATTWVLIFDQFEEFFTHHHDRWAEREHFFTQVSEAVKQNSNLRVVFAMREDYIAELDPYAQQLPGKLRTRFRMERLRRANALEAIREPLKAPSVQSLRREFAPGVADALVDDLLKIRIKSGEAEWEIPGQFVEPVQLQIVCNDLWDKLGPEDNLITFDHLKAVGSVNEALTRFFEKNIREAAAVAGVSEAALRRWFDRTMITPEGYRNTVQSGAEETAGLPNAAIKVLEERRLLRAEQRDGRLWYELSQDRFIRPMQESYKNWLAEQPGDEQTRLNFENRADRWARVLQTGRRDKKLLLDPGELLVAKRWTETEATAGAYSEALYSLIEASEAESIRVEQERERQLAEQDRLRANAEAQRAQALEEQAREQELRFERERELAASERQRDAAERVLAQERQRLAEAQASARQREAEQAMALVEEQRKLAEVERERADEKSFALRRMRRLVVGLAAMFVLALGTAVFAYYQRVEAERQGAEAKRQGDIAVTNAREAEKNALIAEENAAAARRNEELAEASEKAAQIARDEAVREQVEANLARKRAEESQRAEIEARKLAESKQREAEESARIIERQKTEVEEANLAAEQAIANLNEKVEELTATTNQLRIEEARAKSNEQSARSNELAAQALAQLDRDPELSLLLAIEAANAKQTDAARGALREALNKSYIRSSIETSPVGSALGAVFDPAGFILAADSRGGVQRWDVNSPREPKVATYASGPPVQATSVAFSNDRKFVTVVRADGVAEIRKSDGEGQPLILKNDQQPELARVLSAAFSGSGKLVVTGHADGETRVWDADTGKNIAVLLNENPPPSQPDAPSRDTGVQSVSFSPRGGYIVTSVGKDVKVWRVSDITSAAEHGRGDGDSPAVMLHPAKTLSGHIGRVNSAAFNADEKLLITTSDDRTARIWTVNNDIFETRLQLIGHEAAVTGAALSPDGRNIATVSKDGTARVWEVETGQPVIKLLGHKRPVNYVSFSDDGTRLITTDTDGLLRIWEVAGQQTALSLKEHDKVLSALVPSPDGRLLVTTSFDNTARVWELVSGRLLAGPLRHDGPVINAAFSADGRRLLTISDDRTARLWNPLTGEPGPVLRGHEQELRSASLSADGSFAITTSYDGTARVWDASAGREIASLSRKSDEGGSELPSAAISPDGKLAATVFAGRNVSLWDIAEARERPFQSGHTASVRSVAFSPDGKFLITASTDGTARIWEVASTARPRVVLEDGAVLMGAWFGEGGKRVITQGLRTATVWDAATGQKLFRVDRSSGSGGFIRASLSTDEQFLLVASADEGVRVWDVSSANEVLSLDQSQQSSAGAIFIPGGKRFVTVSLDPKLPALVYDCTACGTISDFREAALRQKSREMTPDEQVRYLKVNPGDCPGCADFSVLLGDARQRVLRPLTASEKRIYNLAAEN
jgi:WD40 repeat protein